ncbi:MAG: hypothetical protein KBB15_02500, partial [Firmicutes bacterium]|nr:hypothetical protein [Bacillota bacterium]
RAAPRVDRNRPHSLLQCTGMELRAAHNLQPEKTKNKRSKNASQQEKEYVDSLSLADRRRNPEC